jgi:hypothetical protein
MNHETIEDIARDIGTMLAKDPDFYVEAWLAAVRRLLVKYVATTPLGNRSLLISQLDMIDAALQVVEDARAPVLGRTPSNQSVRHPVNIRLRDGRLIQMDRRRKVAA